MCYSRSSRLPLQRSVRFVTISNYYFLFEIVIEPSKKNRTTKPDSVYGIRCLWHWNFTNDVYETLQLSCYVRFFFFYGFRMSAVKTVNVITSSAYSSHTQCSCAFIEMKNKNIINILTVSSLLTVVNFTERDAVVIMYIWYISTMYYDRLSDGCGTRVVAARGETDVYKKFMWCA